MKKVILNLLIVLPISILASGNVEISGKVSDQLTGSPLFECHVYLSEHYGVLTDEKGFFKLEIPKSSENEKLHISYVGFETIIEPLVNIKSDFIDVELVQDITNLEALVFVGIPPWNELKEVVIDLSVGYESKEEFYTVLFKELRKIDSEIECKKVRESGHKKAGLAPPSLNFLLVVTIILSAGALMFRPVKGRHKNPRNA